MKKFRIQISKFRILVCLIPALSVLLFIFPGETSADFMVKADHDNIKIGFFYHGDTVTISGELDTGRYGDQDPIDLVVKIASPDGHQSFRKKGKIGGLLWMTVGNLKFEHVPNLYLLHSTGKLEDVLDPEEMWKNEIGYLSLKRRVEIDPLVSDEEKTRWFNEFVKYKEVSGLYASSSGGITTNMESGQLTYHIKMAWPYQAPPGDYLATVYAIKNKKITEKTETKIHVEQVGAVKTLAEMAKTSAAFYGLISILVALTAGFGVGVIFGKGGGSH
jgi:uncharacterized protein (TIGR02186 family)